MKKLIAIYFFCLAPAFTAYGQSFSSTADSTGDTLSHTFQAAYEFQNTLVNNNTDSIYIAWHVDLSASSLPAHWSASVCDNTNCYVYDGLMHNSGKIAPHASAVWQVTISPDTNANGTGWVTEILTDNSGITTKSVTYMLNALPAGVVTLNSPDDNVIIYPNPAYNTVNVFSSNPVNITVTDLSGKELISVKETHIADIGRLNKGTYLIEVFNKNNVLIKTDKLVKE